MVVFLLMLAVAISEKCQCKMVNEDGGFDDSFECGGSSFNPKECIIYTELNSIKNLPVEIKELRVLYDGVDLTVDEMTTINKLVIGQDFAELDFRGNGYLVINRLENEKTGESVSISTGISVDFNTVNTQLNLEVRSDSIVRYFDKNIKTAQVSGIVQFKKEVYIEELIMLSNGYASFFEKYTINTLKMLSTDSDLADLLLFKSNNNAFPDYVLSGKTQEEFDLRICCNKKEMHLVKKGNEVKCMVQMCYLSNHLEPETCFSAHTDKSEYIPSSVMLQEHYNLSIVITNPVYQLIIPETMNIDLYLNSLTIEEVVVQGSSTLRGVYQSVIGKNIKLVDAEIRRLAVIERAEFENTTLKGFVDVTNSELYIKGSLIMDNVYMIASNVVFSFMGGLISTRESKVVILSATFQGDYNDVTTQGWLMTKGELEIEGKVVSKYFNGVSNQCRPIVVATDTKIKYTAQAFSDNDNTVIFDKSSNRIYTCFDFSKELPIMNLEDCKISGEQTPLPSQQCKCPATKCNYLIDEGAEVTIEDDIAGIKGDKLYIIGDDVMIKKMVCGTECSLDGDMTIGALAGDLFNIYGSIEIGDFLEQEKGMVFNIKNRASLSLDVIWIYKVNIFIDDSGTLEMISELLENSYIEVAASGLFVVYDSDIEIRHTQISVSNHPHNAIAFNLDTEAEFTNSSIFIVRNDENEYQGETYILHFKEGSIQTNMQVVTLTGEKITNVFSKIKCGTYLVARPYQDDVACPKSPFNMRGVNVVLVPRKWRKTKDKVLLGFLYVGLLCTGVLATMYVVVSLLRSSRRERLLNN
ncbi:hypothetical protein EIN_405000 [Entamoeba invadens IP1]|uniref:Uncharacterized protein n=1 Tax=Entamoeba invadens IP1 TaxID=370355 RepID=A0A0A1UA91_ENTIV|nr:hypothetical protein EIN_405000 [Entamoeba invadens IP1]ELP90086.1 hypothetical protein EIN_405000 [Entamoeba invadens IP1]|eukprot:XP_004256857.1 hypothetical protein EIN_405000 [Entamoeba invadens IP1]